MPSPYTSTFMKAKVLFATLLTLAFFTAGYAQTLDKAKLDQFFDRLAEKNKAMGSLAIVKDGKVLYSRAIGYSQINGTEKKPLTTANRFRIGSITKMFTATMILQLIEEGKLKLTDRLDEFLPQIPNAGKITIAQILSHRRGIPAPSISSTTIANRERSKGRKGHQGGHQFSIPREFSARGFSANYG
jgi:D-alanyl-D-alanine carboxypeptidase